VRAAVKSDIILRRHAEFPPTSQERYSTWYSRGRLEDHSTYSRERQDSESLEKHYCRTPLSRDSLEKMTATLSLEKSSERIILDREKPLPDSDTRETLQSWVWSW
jgi:hypothetical protein